MRHPGPLWQAEVSFRGEARLVCGVDEAGRGPLAGPVVAAAVILPVGLEVPGLNDSKKLSPAARLRCRDFLMGHKEVVFGLGVVEAAEIDRLNIYEATRQAMIAAIERLGHQVDLALVDGRPWKDFPLRQCGVVAGDGICPSIAAASVLAKCARDDMMLRLHEKDQRYGFDQHKGYATAGHLAALARYGPGPEHRMSFAPVAQAALSAGSHAA